MFKELRNLVQQHRLSTRNYALSLLNKCTTRHDIQFEKMDSNPGRDM